MVAGSDCQRRLKNRCDGMNFRNFLIHFLKLNLHLLSGRVVVRLEGQFNSNEKLASPQEFPKAVRDLSQQFLGFLLDVHLLPKLNYDHNHAR
jgi:hypothetical protein